VTALQEWIADNPDGEIVVDVEAEQVRYDDTVVEGAIDHAMQEALVEGIWDTTALMYSNMSKVERTAADLPYVTSGD
jgi:3-isopropylmalate/(R)-2-methylmalate dehydratase small subunit